MKTKYFSWAIAGLLGLGMTSCEDQLDIPQHGVLNYETYYQTDDEAESATAAMYLQLRGSTFNYNMCLNAMCDDFWSGGGGRNDNADLEKFNEFTFGTEADYIKNLFTTFYQIVYKANVILGHVPEESAVQKRSHAEAKVFRAWSYFHLINLWGTPPIVDHELAPDEYSQPNGTPEALWKLVESDLTDAINSGTLPEKKDVNDQTTWRVTKQYAQALLGKAYLWQNKYGQAASTFDEVIKSGKYKLYDGPYEDMLTVRGNLNCEDMFESVKIDDPNVLNQNIDIVPIMIGWRTDHMSGVTDIGLYNTGWGFLVPQQGLYEEFVKVEGVDGYRLNQTMKTYKQIQDMGVQCTSAMINDGLFMWKWRVLQETNQSTGGWDMINNPRWMRYAEVLLCAAEAHFENGNTGKADEYMNMIRTRAKAPTKSGYTQEEIRREKRLELCGEFTRWMDIARWGIAYDLLKDQGEYVPFLQPNGTIVKTKFNDNKELYGFKKGKHEHLPFPGTEVRLNPNIEQNDGWK